MPLLEDLLLGTGLDAGKLAAYTVVIGTILIGMFFTADDRRNFENILSNILSFAVLIATVDFPFLMLMAMVVYLLLGIHVAHRHLRKYYYLFGSKTYGPFSLVLLMATDHLFGLSDQGLGKFRAGSPGVDGSGGAFISIDWNLNLVNLGTIFVAWVLVSLTAHAISYLHFHHERGTAARRKQTDEASGAATLSAWVHHRHRSPRASRVHRGKGHPRR